MSEAPNPNPEPIVDPVDDPAAALAPAALPGEGSLLAEAKGEDTAAAGQGTEIETAKPEGPDSQSGTDAVLELKLPEGFEVDEAAMTTFQEYAKTNGLSQEAAQAGLDLFSSQVQANVKAVLDSQTAAWKAINDGWKAELEADPAFTGDAKASALTRIGKLFDDPSFGDGAALREAFALTGAGNNPAIVRFLNNLAKTLDEGSFVPGGKPVSKAGRTPGEVLYGSSEG